MSQGTKSAGVQISHALPPSLKVLTISVTANVLALQRLEPR
jgi:hypothetical protein